MNKRSEVRQKQVKWLKNRIYLIKMSASIMRNEKPEKPDYSNFLTDEAEMLMSILNYMIETSANSCENINK